MTVKLQISWVWPVPSRVRIKHKTKMFICVTFSSFVTSAEQYEKVNFRGSSNLSDASLSFLNKLLSFVLIILPLGNANRGRNCLVWKEVPGPMGACPSNFEYVYSITLNIIWKIQIIQQRKKCSSSYEIFIYLKREKDVKLFWTPSCFCVFLYSFPALLFRRNVSSFDITYVYSQGISFLVLPLSDINTHN
jgi:hypothetical protein